MRLSMARLCKGDLRPTIDKLAKRVSGWHGQFFCNYDKLVLVRQVLSAVPAFPDDGEQNGLMHS